MRLSVIIVLILVFLSGCENKKSVIIINEKTYYCDAFYVDERTVTIKNNGITEVIPIKGAKP